MYQSNNAFNEQKHRTEVMRRLNAIIGLLVVIAILLLDTRIGHVRDMQSVGERCDSMHEFQARQIGNVLEIAVDPAGKITMPSSDLGFDWRDTRKDSDNSAP